MSKFQIINQSPNTIKYNFELNKKFKLIKRLIRIYIL